MEKLIIPIESTNEVSDGYHTFGELYEHRITLYIALCKQITNQPYDEDGDYQVWRSKKHSDGELAFGGTWFVLGIGEEEGKQITYHLPIEKWDKTDFAKTREKAPEFDGHTAEDVLKRIENL
jgi:hypothetical protein